MPRSDLGLPLSTRITIDGQLLRIQRTSWHYIRVIIQIAFVLGLFVWIFYPTSPSSGRPGPGAVVAIVAACFILLGASSMARSLVQELARRPVVVQFWLEDAHPVGGRARDAVIPSNRVTEIQFRKRMIRVASRLHRVEVWAKLINPMEEVRLCDFSSRRGSHAYEFANAVADAVGAKVSDDIAER